MILACCCIYRIWCHNIEVRHFMRIYSATLAATTDLTDKQTEQTVKTYLESVAEEVYEYVWTTGKIEYRTGADMSYKSAGTIEEDKMVKRTGITHKGWNRVTVDEKDYYVPGDALTTDIPESLPIADGIKGEYQKYALSLLPDFGWDSSELEPLIYLWNRESGWNPNSHNRGSGAHGIPQALPASKMASEGSDYYTNPEPQIRWGLKYIARRYGSPSAAWAHFCSRGWY
ncbi:MAG: transglycosylase SLT domain-containing protein [Clostridia bacterium]|nr:transglycosylase SLT domain-containing protein [Clostridia bacterium]